MQQVKGSGLDSQTRCRHYHTSTDIVAIKFACCGDYYACYRCHQENTDHPAAVWPKASFDEKAALCGACGIELTISEFLNGDAACPYCGAAFNPGCHHHRHLYFG